MGRVFEGGPDGAGLRFAVVVSRYNDLVTNSLLNGAKGGFARFGVKDDDVDVAWVPGSFELPIAGATLAKTGRYDAVICLGAVLRGDTAHFEYVSNGATTGILRAGLDSGVPVIFGLLTVDTLEQALARAGGHVGNKGYEAALSAIETANLLKAVTA